MAISLVSKISYNLYGLSINPKSGVTITSTLGKTLDIMGIASMIVILDPTLEVDLREVAMSSGDFNQFLMGMYVLSGCKG